MAIRALSSPSVTRTVGEPWEMLFDVRDADGDLTDDAPVVTVTLPNSTTATPTVETLSTGVYRSVYIPGTSGRFLAAAVTTGQGTAHLAAQVSAVTLNADFPDVQAIKDYIGDNASYADADIQDALDAETAAQAQVCEVGAVYPPDLIEALKRRVQRNLELRKLPFGILADAEGGAVGGVNIPRLDAEIRRFESPHRKLVAL